MSRNPLLVRRSWRGRSKQLVAAVLAAVLLVTLAEQPALAQEVADSVRPALPEPEPIDPVPVRAVAPEPPASAPTLESAEDRPEPVWPAGGEAVAVVPGVPVHDLPGAALPDGGTVTPAASVSAGGLLVRTDRISGQEAPGRVAVEVLDQAATQRSAVDGVLLRVVPQAIAGHAGGDSGQVRLSVNYGGFETGFGADWASRLRLVAMPAECFSSPAGGGCVGEPLPSDNNLITKTVSAEVDLADGPVVLALAAAPSGPTGDYSATSLQPSSVWTAGGSSGGFTWSYPVRVPPGVGGPTPRVELSYASQSVDGRHAASNNQPSWVGEGFEAWPGGFIERRYRPCADDMDGGASNSQETGDLCWVRNNAVLNLNGASGELIYNSGEDRWHLRSDDGSRIERRTGATNGDDNGEYWVVTTTDGTEYWFGRNRLPGWSSGDPVTNAAWTVPVFGNHSGEPCRGSSFASSWCDQGWRWNLDYVVDVHGNSMSYWYSQETNRYGRNLDPANATTYVRGGYLRHISYGTVRDGGDDSVFEADAPAQVVFATGSRCLSSCSSHTATRWPDTPWDQECTGSTCDTFAPTFWSTKRLASITTRVRGGSSYRNVERWTFTHSFPDPGDTTRAGLWLSSIAHQGLAGGTVGVPDVEFTPVSLDNRVDGIDHSPAMAWHRIARIDTETGGAIAVTYSDRDCVSSKPTLHTNTRRCYPVYWRPEGEEDLVLDWFHKYVVTEVREIDDVAEQPEVVYSYSYPGGGAWHYTDDDGLVDDDARTWSVWRGFGRVGVTVGEPGTQRTYTETRYFRGMHGDRLPSGSRDVDVTDSQGGTWTDEDWFSGMVRENVVFNGPGGAEVSGEIHDPWASSATASRTIGGSTVHARFTNTRTVWSRVALDAGRGDRVSRVTTTFDSMGMPTQVDDHGDVDVSGDEQCATYSYSPRNTGAWLMDRVHRTRGFAVGCAAAGDPGSLDESDLISDVRTSYDGQGYGTAPTRGLATREEEMSAWNGGSPTYVTVAQSSYDRHGRVTEVRDALNRPTGTSYTPAEGGPVTGTATTNALGHVTTSTIDPAYGLPTRTVDPNGKITDQTYDGLGRLTGVWLPGRDQGTATANVTFAYGVRDSDVSYVSTSRLNAREQYVTSHVLFDGLLRGVQTQAVSPEDGRLLTNTFYDNTGRAFRSYGSYYATGAPSTTLHMPVNPQDVPTQNDLLFDGAGRVTAEVFRPYLVERWRTSYQYGGDRVAVTPPAGGTAQVTISDVRDRTVELRQYHAPTPTGSFDATTYDYNRKGQLAAVTDPAGNEWSYVYDLRGRQIEAHDPDAGVTRRDYDNADQLVRVRDGRNAHALLYHYDVLGRKIRLQRNSSTGPLLASWQYDTVAKGQLTRSVRWFNNQAYEKWVTGYNDYYQPTGTETVIPPTESGLGGTYASSYLYNVDGTPRSVAYPGTDDLFEEGVEYIYDAVYGLPIGVRGASGAPTWEYVTATRYNALAQVEQITLETSDDPDIHREVRLSYTREPETGRLTEYAVALDDEPGIATEVQYEYDHAGNITQVRDTTTDPADTQCLTYDHLRRLTQAWTPTSGDCQTAPTTGGLGGPAPYWQTWTYDQVGNRLTEIDHRPGATTSTTSYTYPPPGAAQPHTLTSATTGSTTQSWAYDSGGNTITRPDGSGGTQTLTWNEEARLASLTDTAGTTSYIYDADGNRLVTRDPDGKTLYLPGQEVRWDQATNTTTTTRYYDYLDQTIASRTADGLTWLGSDHQGTAHVAITEQDQEVQIRRQTPFGEPRGTTIGAWPNPHGFVGGEHDRTGLVHLGAREYDPVVGRFVSVDPLIDVTDPQQINGYTYSKNNPITWSDPDGLLPGGTDAHDTAVHLRWLDLIAQYGPNAQISISPRTQPGADIVCWNCSSIASDGALDVIWVWEVKTENQGLTRARKSRNAGASWVERHELRDGRQVQFGPRFDHKSAAPNRGNPRQLVTVRSVDAGVELYSVTEDDCVASSELNCRADEHLAFARQNALKHRELSDQPSWFERAVDAFFLGLAAGLAGGAGGASGNRQRQRNSPQSQSSNRYGSGGNSGTRSGGSSRGAGGGSQALEFFF